MKKRISYNVIPGRWLCLRFVVPTAYRNLGEKKTAAKVLKRFWWPGVTAMTREHIRSCAYCLLHKVLSGRTRGLFHPVPPPRIPFDCVDVDLVGPFQVTKRGNRHLIFAIDYMTYRIEAPPVASTDAASTCRSVREDLVMVTRFPKLWSPITGRHYITHPSHSPGCVTNS